MQTQATIEAIGKKKVVAILRRVYEDDLYKLVEALAEGGLGLVEVTFDQGDPDGVKKTSNAISELNKRFGDRMLVGAGTVLNPAQVDAAAGAGAKYIISPNVSQKVIEHTKEIGLVSMPGAMTPSEMLSAHDFGADFIKVFPYGDLGLSYMKSIIGPINHLKFIATGGVTEANLPELLDFGFTGAGIGNWLSDRKLIEAGDFAEFTRRAKAFTAMVEARA